jgi:diaminohydroxyphosphoribosylaminopyrimidine deaminase/5-amino-6-(5-phosphoribosylamino)uracil reductase
MLRDGAFLRLGQGTESAEAQAVRQVGPAARGSTAYLNLETGDCHGDSASVAALVQSGVSRCCSGALLPSACVC